MPPGRARAVATNHIFDVAVIGGGTVGCAVLRALTLEGYSTVLLEKGPSLVGSNASGGNTGIACTAAGTVEGSLERECLLHGISMNRDVYRRLNIPHCPRGALYVAWTEEELARLESLAEQQRSQGDHDVAMVGRRALCAWEPALSERARGAMLVPGETLVDPWLVPIALAHHALQNGACLELSCPVAAAEPPSLGGGGPWRLATPRGTVSASVVVNCGGLWADHVERLRRTPPFQVQPKRGDYVVFAAPQARLLSRPIGQVPQPGYRGVYVWQTLHGNVACGPTAIFQDDRDVARAPPEVIEDLRRIAVQTVPELGTAKVLASYSGLRPATEFDDYQIEPCWEGHWITVGGVRSTGLTASLGIGKYVCGLAESMFAQLPGVPPARAALPHAKWTPLPDLEQVYKSFCDRGDGTVSIHGRVHTVTHPLCRIGYSGTREE